jgi:hypothetical protein
MNSLAYAFCVLGEDHQIVLSCPFFLNGSSLTQRILGFELIPISLLFKSSKIGAVPSFPFSVVLTDHYGIAKGPFDVRRCSQ